MKLKQILPITAAGLFLITFSLNAQQSSNGGLTGIVQVPESGPAQTAPVGRYRRGAPQAQLQVQTPVLIWLVKQNGGAIHTNEPVVLDQENLEFNPGILAVRQNGIVRIRNSDPVYHNVFSLSSTKRFDVGRRPKGEYLDVKFERQGVVEVFCDIHSNMHAIIYVIEPAATNWTGITAGEEFNFSTLPAGNYTLNIFSPGLNLYSNEISITGGEIKDLGNITLR